MKQVKRCLAMLLMLAIVVGVLPVQAEAENLRSGDWEYSISGIGATIVKYHGYDSNVIIPSTLGGQAVTAIGDNAMENNYFVTSLTIPQKVTSIGYHAFKGCTQLSRINYNAINCNAYYNRPFENAGTSASSLSVVFGPSVKYIPSRLFDSYDASDYVRITSVTVSSSVTTIGEYAFARCQDLSTISWSNGVTKIEEGAFCNCTSLKNLVLPTSLIQIGDCAFENNYKLASITIPGKVTSIGYHAFKGCTQLSKIYYNSVSCDSYYNRPFENVGTSAPSLAVIFGSSVRSISSRLFDSYEQSDYARVTSVIIPSSVQKIGEYAFANCQDLKSISIPSSVGQIDEGAFVNCDDLIISGYANTAAQFYANENGIPFKSLTKNLSTPKISKLENVNGGIKLTWTKVSGATKYRILRKDGSKWVKIGDTTKTSFTWKKAKSGVKYTFTVRCISKDGKSNTSNYHKTGKSIKYIAAPKLTKVQNTKAGVKVTWKKSTGAAKYRVLRKTGNGKWIKVGDTTKLTFVDKKAKRGVKYTYSVRCVSKNSKSITSGYNTKGLSIKRK